MFYWVFIILFLLLGIYFIINVDKPSSSSSSSLLEGYINSTNTTVSCPNILLQKGIRYYLYNSKLAIVPGVNPIEFQNLEDYTEFIDWQRSQGIRCPVLYLQYSYNAQGEPIYKGRPGPTNLQGGLPPAPPTNTQNNTNADSTYLIDNTSTSTSTSTTTNDQSSYNANAQSDDNLLHSNQSANAMDDNWGGAQFTQSLVDAGVYEGDNVSIQVN
jgi:hypothetical protein